MEENKVIDQIEELSKKLDNGITLTSTEKRQMTGMGSRREAFVRAEIKLLEEDDSFLPRNYNPEDFVSSYNSFTNYSNILGQLDNLRKKVYDHFIKYGTNSFKEALKIKKLLDNNPQEEYADVREQIKAYFEKKTRRAKIYDVTT